MERLLSDAEKLTGKKYDLSNLNDVYEAIHAIQEEYNITGTTSKEASKTIEGSMNSLKASWENFLTALGGGGSLSKAINALFESAGNVAKNIIPRVFIIVKNIIVGVLKMLPKLVNYISDGVSKLADMIGNAGAGGGGKLMAGAFKLMTKFVIAMIKAIPKLAGSLLQLVASLAMYIANNGPQLVQCAKKLMTDFVTGFLQGHPMLQKAAKAIIDHVFKPLETVIGIVSKAVKTLIKWWKKLTGQKDKKKFKVEAPFSKQIQAMKDVYKKWKDILGQKVKKTFKVAKEGFTSVLNSMKSIYNKWKDILSQKAKKTFTVENRKTSSGGKGHRIGLREVPYDGYEAVLHKGEAVMTAAEVNKLKKNESVVKDSGNLTVNVYGSDNMSVTELAAAVERRIINLQKRRTAAWV